MMGKLRAACGEFFGLFVDDGTLAAAILVWIGIGALLSRVLPQAAVAPLWAVGLMGLLLENVARTARRSRLAKKNQG